MLHFKNIFFMFVEIHLQNVSVYVHKALRMYMNVETIC